MRKIYSLFAAVVLAVNVFGQSTYTLVTSDSDLEAGAKYILASGATGSVKVMGYQANNNRPESTSSVTVSSGSITLTPAAVSTDQTSAYEITLGGATGAWVLNDNVNAIILGPAPTGNNNYLKANAAATYTITISSNAAVMTAVTGTNSDGRNIIKYNNANSLFASYKSGQADVYLYKKSEEIDPTPSITANPTSLNFGQIVTGESSTASDVTVTGLNLDDVPTYSVTGTDAANFAVSGTLTTDGGTLSVIFTPSSTGTKTATLTITSGTASATVALSGEGKEEAPTGTYSETFETQTALTTSYASGSFDGEAESVTVNYVDSRNEDTYGITGKGLIFKSNTGSAEFVIPDGVGTFTFEYRKAYTGGNNNRSLSISVDGVQVAVTPTFGEAGTDATVHSFTYDVNKEGSVSVKISNVGTQVTIDNVVWTEYDETLSVNNAITKVSLVKNTSVDNEIIFAQDAKVSLVNMNGQVVKTAQVSADKALNVAGLPKGMYVVTAVVNGKTVSQKIIKK